jgi:hypothetical protein
MVFGNEIDMQQPPPTQECMICKMAETFENGLKNLLQDMPDVLLLDWDDNYLENAAEIVGPGFEAKQTFRYGMCAMASFSTFCENVENGVISVDDPNDEMTQQYGIIVENIEFFRKLFDNHMLVQLSITKPVPNADDNGEHTIPPELAVLFVMIIVIKKSSDYEIPENVLEEYSEKFGIPSNDIKAKFSYALSF